LDVAHHSIAYTSVQPRPFEGEKIVRHAIKIEAKAGEELSSASRINFSKIYTVEHKVKVKAIGRVADDYLPWVLRYYMQSNGLSGSQQSQ
jgi:hypothetical protein